MQLLFVRLSFLLLRQLRRPRFEVLILSSEAFTFVDVTSDNVNLIGEMKDVRLLKGFQIFAVFSRKVSNL